MGKKTALVPLVALALASFQLAEGQQQARMIKIGEIVFGIRPGGEIGIGRQLLRRELRQLGYVEGTNVVFETRSAGGKVDRFRALADELVRLKVDVILATSFSEILATKNATKTIPIVFMTSGDPVAAGIVDSLARPGALAKLLIEKGLITREEFVQKISEERATYQKLPESNGSMNTSEILIWESSTA